MPAVSGKILVIANSGRMLASFLHDAGFDVVVIDCFADLDMRKVACDFIHVTSLALEKITGPVEILLKRHSLMFAVYGSGLEKHCDSVHFLEKKLIILGNKSVTFSAVQDTRNFFLKLGTLAIDYPEVLFQPPLETAGWLCKPLQGEGGGEVRRYRVNQTDVRRFYWQRYIEGKPMSVLFLADRAGGVHVVGFQHQLTAAGNTGTEFFFAGVVTAPDLPDSLRSQVISWVIKLTECYQLTGLNSLDFIVSHQQCFVLEINARPTASLQLYNADVIRGHIASCQGKVTMEIAPNKGVRAYKIIYARFRQIVNIGIKWPDWVTDRPEPGSIIGHGRPICSIIARADTYQQLLNCLSAKERIIEHLLQTGS